MIIFSSACESRGPVLQGFECGTFGGFVCPPGSTCDSCAGEDCGSPCYATVACDPTSSAPGCPSGTRCATSTDYCVPERTCSVDADCAAGELCVTRSGQPLSVGLCMAVESTPPGSCDPLAARAGGDSCPFPWFCASGECALSCDGQSCPGALTCVDRYCVPP
jgi:hypothetical protein